MSFWFWILLFGTHLLAAPVRFDMRDAGGRNLVYFISEGLLEKTVGITNAVFGFVELDPNRLSDGIKGEFEVDVRTFHTGIAPRDEFLREKLLAASEYSTALFTIQKSTNTTSGILTGDGRGVGVRVEGLLKIKGMERPQGLLFKFSYFRQTEATRQRLPGNLLKLTTHFDIDLKDFGIQVIEKFKHQSSRFVQVSADLLGTDQVFPASTLAPPPPHAK